MKTMTVLLLLVLAVPASSANLMCSTLGDLAVTIAEARDNGTSKARVTAKMRETAAADPDVSPTVLAVSLGLADQIYGSTLSPSVVRAIAIDSCEKAFR